ncbi:MAG TPA: hypothetical protein VG367_18595 [Mucilaginibacter sp.]|jgi:hypothetical protein|nr:hypothetical protein [Mucilaginibacter sp.]
MKTIITCGTIVLLLLSCQKSAVSPVQEHKPISSHALQKSTNGSFTINQQFDINLAGQGVIEFSSCNGDLLEVVSGVEHVDFHETVNQNHSSTGQHVNIQNLKLVSLTTGVEYTGSAVDNFSDNFDSTDRMILTESETIRLMTPGGKNNSVIKFDLHETVDPEGNVTGYVDNYRQGCQ